MPFLRFSRDKRGYEHYHLVQPANRRGKAPRLLYWFRTPPNVKVGRQPFDPDMRRALEAQNPGINFDWTAIVETPIPPVADTERWRERRRMERASRQSAATESDEPAEPVAEEVPAQREPVAMASIVGQEVAPVSERDEVAPAADNLAMLPVDSPDIITIPGSAAATPSVVDPASPPTTPPVTPGDRSSGRGRRRRRRRHKPQHGPGSGFQVQRSPAQVPGAEADVPASESEERERGDVQDSGEPGDDEP